MRGALTIHRRNNLVLTLIMLGKLGEARQILAANWRLNAPPHANTTPRIAFLRHVITLLESQPDTRSEFRVHAVRPPEGGTPNFPWDITHFIEFLKLKLGEHNAEFLNALVVAMIDRSEVAKLDLFDFWKNTSAVALATPWPD